MNTVRLNIVQIINHKIPSYLAKPIVNQFVLLHLRVLITPHTGFGHDRLEYITKRDDVTFIEHASWKFLPYWGKTGKKLEAHIN